MKDKEAQEKIATTLGKWLHQNYHTKEYPTWDGMFPLGRKLWTEDGEVLDKFLQELGYRKLPLLSDAEIGHILETQKLLCELGKSNKDDGSCSLCRSIKAKLRPQVRELS